MIINNKYFANKLMKQEEMFTRSYTRLPTGLLELGIKVIFLETEQIKH